jgi:hypothetical protein
MVFFAQLFGFTDISSQDQHITTWQLYVTTDI